MNFFSASLESEKVPSILDNEKESILRNPMGPLYSLGHFLLEYTTQSSRTFEKEKESDKISDEDFQAVVKQLRNRGYMTHAGAKHIYEQRMVPDPDAPSTKLNEEKSDTSANPKSLFDGKENFLTQACRKVEEGSYQPVFRRRDSQSQMEALRRVSVLQWNNMSQKWSGDNMLLEVEDENENISRRSLRTTDILNDSILSVNDMDLNDVKYESENDDSADEECNESSDNNRRNDRGNSLLVSFRRGKGVFDKSLLVPFKTDGSTSAHDSHETIDSGSFALYLDKEECAKSTRRSYLAIFQEVNENDIILEESDESDLRSSLTMKLPSNKSLKCVKVKEV